MSKRDVLRLHHKGFEEMTFEDEATEEQQTEKVAICTDCFARTYPDGIDDDYVDPDVLWPCPTIKALRA